jgi:CspA family cold shock protein
LLAFGRKFTQAIDAIYVLACLSAIRLASGRPFTSHPLQPDCSLSRPICAWIKLIWRPSMAIGTVKFFNAAKGFGFIAPEDGSKDVFVHATALESAGMGTLTEGQRVSFEVVEERGRPAAGNLKAA